MKPVLKRILFMLLAVLMLPVFQARAETGETGPEMVACFGKEFPSDTEFLDLNDIAMESTAQVEEILPLFPNLKQVDMCRCGIPDEEMAALNEKYPEIKFVWEITICTYYELRTDITYFMAFQIGLGHGTNLDFSNLKYCRDLQLIDLGHYIVNDNSFLNGMPKLKFLIQGDGRMEDLSNIGNCTSLEFLEIFLNPVTDFAPLTNLTNLRDLNISFTPICERPGAGYVQTDEFGDVTPLYQMAWLDRLWVCGTGLKPSEQDALQAALPHTQMMFVSASSTDKGWRHSPRYFAGRDIVGGVYMVA